jgi:hypothetical protein
MKRFAFLLAVSAAVSLVAPASIAGMLVHETFTHPDGNLVGNTPTPGPGGVWTNHSGTGEFIQVSGGKITLNQGDGSREDAHTQAATGMGTGDTWYAGFDLSVSGGADVATTYFAHFWPAEGYYYRSRVFVTACDGGDFTIGLAAASSTMQVAWPSCLAFDTTYRVLVSHDYDTDDSYLWIDPYCPDGEGGNPSISNNGGYPGTTQDGFAFRQSTGDTSQLIDNLRVATTFNEACIPEPASLLLLGLGFCLIRRR